VKKAKAVRPDWATSKSNALFKAVYNLRSWMSWEKPERGCIMQFTFQSPAHTGRKWRMIVKGGSELGEHGVAFIEADAPEDLLIRLNAGLSDGTLKWREDKPYNSPEAVEARRVRALKELSTG
jgi:hypothetical protein